LEAYGGAYQPEERLEGVGDMPTQEEITKENNMSEEEAEQQPGDETIEMEPAVGGKIIPQKKKKMIWGIK
jgi:hypothetical protein